MTDTTPTNDEYKAAKAKALAAKAEAKALRPWYLKKRFIIPIVLILFIGFSSQSRNNDTQDLTAIIPTPDASDTSSSEVTSVPETWTDGTYIVGDDIQPGRYRVTGYWSRLDGNQEIIDNELIYGDGLSILDVLPTDAFIEISGAAQLYDESKPVDPIAQQLTDGTYVVGIDIQPGTYRITGDGAYFARLDCNHEIIDNNLSDGSVIGVVQPSDCMFKFSGTITKVG